MVRDDEYLMWVIIYEKKETKLSQHMQIELFFLEEENRESKNLWVIPGNVAHCSKFVIHFFLIKGNLSTFFLIKGNWKIKENKN